VICKTLSDTEYHDVTSLQFQISQHGESLQNMSQL